MPTLLTKLSLTAALVVPSLAQAETRVTSPRPEQAPAVAGLDITVNPRGYLTARQALVVDPGTTVAPPDGQPTALMASRYIYLNKNGVTLTPGNNNSGNNRSTLVNGTSSVPAWNVSATGWQQVVGCVQELFAPFAVTVSDQAPAAGVRHLEAVFGGTAQDVIPDAPQGVLGVSPFTTDCNIIEDSIVFTFTTSAVQYLGNDYREICEIAAQEIAHSVGLDHVLNASDPMTYLTYNGNRSFKSGAVQCGEDTPRQCGLVNQGFPACRANQDSVGLLGARLGLAPGGGGGGTDLPPTIAITSPGNDDVVPPGFTVYADADDDTAVVRVELFVDGALVATDTSAPYQFDAPDSLVDGDHEVQVVAFDAAGESTTTINVQVQAGADPIDPPTGGGGGSTDPQTITGGCSSSGHPAGVGLLGLALIGLIRRRRR